MLDNEWGMTTYPFVPGHEGGRPRRRARRAGQGAEGRPARRHRLERRTAACIAGSAWPATSTCAARCSGRSPAATAGSPTACAATGSGRSRCPTPCPSPRPDRCCAAASRCSTRSTCRHPPDRPRRRRRHRRARAHGAEVLPRLGLRSHRVHLQRLESPRRPARSARTASCPAATRTAIQALAGTLDLILDTVNVPLDWDALLGALAPGGRMHVVGAVLEPIPVAAFALIFGQKSVSGSPTGSRGSIDAMLDFAARHAHRAADRALPDEPGQRGARAPATRARRGTGSCSTHRRLAPARPKASTRASPHGSEHQPLPRPAPASSN